MVSIGKAFLSNHKKHCENHFKKMKASTHNKI